MRLETRVTVWKSVVGYEGLYEVNNHGEVRSLYYNGKYGSGILKLSKKQNNYLCCGFRKGGIVKTIDIHRIVASAFIKNTRGYTEVNHIDGNRHNNDVNNLEWCSHSQNIQHAVKTGLKKNKTSLFCRRTTNIFK